MKTISDGLLKYNCLSVLNCPTIAVTVPFPPGITSPAKLAYPEVLTNTDDPVQFNKVLF